MIKPTKHDFTTLITEKSANNTTNTFVKLPISSYSDLGFALNSILQVCRYALETESTIDDNFHYSRLLEIAQNLIPHAELDYMSRVQDQAFKSIGNADD